MCGAAFCGLVAIFGCGSRATAYATSPPGFTTLGDELLEVLDLPTADCADAEIVSERRRLPCSRMVWEMGTRASCAIVASDCTDPLDGEAFQRGACPTEVGGWAECPDEEFRLATKFRVLAMNRSGNGHIVGWCDSTTLVELLEKIPLARYLGQTTSPRVASIGDSWPCKAPSIPGATYLGPALPDRYVQEPAQLAVDWDVVILCERIDELESLRTLTQVMRRFVVEDGKGLLVSRDYIYTSDLYPLDEEREAILGDLTGPAGFVFDPIALGWSRAAANEACVPDF